jgi:uncharacterized protein YqgC (DUF456 family)
MDYLPVVLLLIAVLVGIAGTVVPVVPGSLLVAVAAVAYAFSAQSATVTVAAVVACVVLLIGGVVPAKAVGGKVEKAPLILGGVLALIGFFVVPVIGLLLGFILGVLLGELLRTRSFADAIPATRAALYAAGLSMIIELAATIIGGGIILSAAAYTLVTG